MSEVKWSQEGAQKAVSILEGIARTEHLINQKLILLMQDAVDEKPGWKERFKLVITDNKIRNEIFNSLNKKSKL